MNRWIMIKISLLTCSVFAILMILSNLCFSNTISKKTPRNNSLAHTLVAYPETTEKTLNFADEPMPVDDKLVVGKMNRSLNRHRFRNVQSTMLHRKAEKWFPIIEPILKAHGIPDDFKYIPIVEAGFSEGKSSRGAYGPWQFMPGTARTYGLKVNAKEDDRVNIRKATIAACKYLHELHREFHSWILVAAAFNTGSPNLENVISKQKQKNYFRMKLNRETGVYVYNLIAVKEIINNPEVYGYNYHKPKYGVDPQYTPDLLAVN